MKASLKKLLPAATYQWLCQVFRWRWFRGWYAMWAEASQAAGGYDDGAILEQVLQATREVRPGRALWDRDGTTFMRPEVNVPLLSILRQISAVENGRLDVVDFGGGLDGTWWQHRLDLAAAVAARWRVVEQPHLVSAGVRFASPVLSFHHSIADASTDEESAVILLSSVLPYLESSAAMLEEVDRRGFRHVIIDRTPLVLAGATRLAVQPVPLALSGGSYPAWLFDRKQMLEPLREHYDLTSEWAALDALDPDAEHRGFYFLRKA